MAAVTKKGKGEAWRPNHPRGWVEMDCRFCREGCHQPPFLIIKNWGSRRMAVCVEEIVITYLFYQEWGGRWLAVFVGKVTRITMNYPFVKNRG